MAQCGWYGNVRSWQLEPKIFSEGKGKVLTGTINKWEEASPFPVPTSRLPLAPLIGGSISQGGTQQRRNVCKVPAPELQSLLQKIGFGTETSLIIGTQWLTILKLLILIHLLVNWKEISHNLKITFLHIFCAFEI